MAVSDPTHEGRNNNLRALAAHGENSVVEHAVVAPAGEGFFLSLREAEVDFGAPELLGPIIFTCFQEFVGPDEAQRIVGLRRHGILATLAAGQRQQRAACAQAAREIGQQGAVFVVGVSHDHHHAGGGGKSAKGLFKSSCAAVFGDGNSDAVRFAKPWGRELGGLGGGGRLLRSRKHSGEQGRRSGNDDVAR